MNKYAYHLEEPRVGQSYPNYYAAKLASKFGKVVLSGCGGDELFGGYPWRYFYTEKFVDFQKFVDSYYLKWQRLIPNSTLKNLLTPIWNEISHIWTKDIFRDIFLNVQKNVLSSSDCLNASLYLEAKTFLHGLLVVEDKLSMAHGLETRVPFLDNDLVDFASQLPLTFKINYCHQNINENDLSIKRQISKDGKKILRKTLSKYLDKQIINNKKQGFSSPDASWFKGESIDYVKHMISSSLLIQNNIFDSKTLNNLTNMHFQGQQNKRLFIWSFLNLEHILRKFF